MIGSFRCTTSRGGTCNYGALHLGAPNGWLQLDPTLFANLPSCASGTEGTQKPVSDSTTNTWGASITGGGSDYVLAIVTGPTGQLPPNEFVELFLADRGVLREGKRRPRADLLLGDPRVGLSRIAKHCAETSGIGKYSCPVCRPEKWRIAPAIVSAVLVQLQPIMILGFRD